MYLSSISRESLIEGKQRACYSLEILYPLFRVARVGGDPEVNRVPKAESVSRKRKRGISTDEWEDWQGTCNTYLKDTFEASHPGQKMVSADDGQWTLPRSRDSPSRRKERGDHRVTGNAVGYSIGEDAGVFSHECEQYMWSLSKTCQDVQLYEACMGQRIRR